MRRRGDSWYLNSLEPPPDFIPIAAGFDPLQDLIAEAHANGIEVHAFVIIGAGNVEAAHSLTVKIDRTAPTISISADPSVIWPPNGKTVPVAISGAGADPVSGLTEVSYVVMDEYGLPLGVPLRLLSGGSATWADQLAVEARRDGYDLDGRVYQVVATLSDVAGNTATATVIIRVPHDRR